MTLIHTSQQNHSGEPNHDEQAACSRQPTPSHSQQSSQPPQSTCLQQSGHAASPPKLRQPDPELNHPHSQADNSPHQAKPHASSGVPARSVQHARMQLASHTGFAEPPGSPVLPAEESKPVKKHVPTESGMSTTLCSMFHCCYQTQLTGSRLGLMGSMPALQCMHHILTLT